MRRAASDHWQSRIKNHPGLNSIFFATDTEGQYEFPRLRPTDFVPEFLWPYNERKKFPKSGNGAIHFFLDDYWFSNVWNYPTLTTPPLGAFPAVLTPDFSLYRGWPLMLQLWNTYRTRWLGAWWQSHGYTVIPTVNWSTPDSYAFAFDGLPEHGTLAIATLETSRDEDTKAFFLQGFREMLTRCQPHTLLVYGKGFSGSGGLEEISIEQGGLIPNIIRFPYHRDQLKAAKSKAEQES